MEFNLQKNTDDPLLRLIFERYALNLLSPPRENVSVYDIFVDNGKKVITAGNLKNFVPIDVERISSITNEIMSDVSSILSGHTYPKPLLLYIEAYLNSMGAQNVYPVLRSPYETKGGHSIRISFADATRDYTNPLFLSHLLYSLKPPEASNFLLIILVTMLSLQWREINRLL